MPNNKLDEAFTEARSQVEKLVQESKDKQQQLEQNEERIQELQKEIAELQKEQRKLAGQSPSLKMEIRNLGTKKKNAEIKADRLRQGLRD